jgi:OHCU decarboxylase
MTVAPTPRLLPIDELNRLDRAEFVRALRPLFEAADPLADRLFAGRPYADYDALLARAEAALAELAPAERVAVVNAHPRIGESARVVRASSALSYKEQGYEAEAGMDPAAVERVYAELAELNRRYEERHGFRFVVFVNGRPKAEILEVLRGRLGNPTERELATALADMLAIARDRLRALRAAPSA